MEDMTRYFCFPSLHNSELVCDPPLWVKECHCCAHSFCYRKNGADPKFCREHEWVGALGLIGRVALCDISYDNMVCRCLSWRYGIDVEKERREEVRRIFEVHINAVYDCDPLPTAHVLENEGMVIVADIQRVARGSHGAGCKDWVDPERLRRALVGLDRLAAKIKE